MFVSTCLSPSALRCPHRSTFPIAKQSFSPASCGFGSISHDRTPFFFPSSIRCGPGHGGWTSQVGLATDADERVRLRARRPSSCSAQGSVWFLSWLGHVRLVGIRSDVCFFHPPPSPTRRIRPGVGRMASAFLWHVVSSYNSLSSSSSWSHPSSSYASSLSRSICSVGRLSSCVSWVPSIVVLGFTCTLPPPQSNGRDTRSTSTVSQSRATPIPLGWISSTMAPQDDPTPIGRAGSVSGSNRWIGPPISPSKRERTGGIDGTSTPLDGSFLRSSPNPTNTKEKREETHEGSTSSEAVDHRRVTSVRAADPKSTCTWWTREGSQGKRREEHRDTSTRMAKKKKGNKRKNGNQPNPNDGNANGEKKKTKQRCCRTRDGTEVLTRPRPTKTPIEIQPSTRERNRPRGHPERLSSRRSDRPRAATSPGTVAHERETRTSRRRRNVHPAFPRQERDPRGRIPHEPDDELGSIGRSPEHGKKRRIQRHIQARETIDTVGRRKGERMGDGNVRALLPIPPARGLETSRTHGGIGSGIRGGVHVQAQGSLELMDPLHVHMETSSFHVEIASVLGTTFVCSIYNTGKQKRSKGF